MESLRFPQGGKSTSGKGSGTYVYTVATVVGGDEGINFVWVGLVINLGC